jgi:hypothetical protein
LIRRISRQGQAPDFNPELLIGILFLVTLIGVSSWALIKCVAVEDPDPKACEEACLKQVQEDIVTMAAYQQILTQAVQELYKQVEQMRQDLHETEKDHGEATH